MKTSVIAAPLFATLLALGSAPAFAKSGASGTVTLKGDTWSVTDAVATLDGEELNLVFASQAFARATWAEDGQFDTFDLWKFDGDADGQSLTLRVGKDNRYAGYSTKVSGGGGGGFNSKHETSVTISSRDAKRVTGAIKLADEDLGAEIKFDLPIQPFGPLARPGTALPKDGGEPGKALVASVEARRSGDIDRLIAVSPPGARAELEAAKGSGEMKEALEFIQAMTPSIDKITGGAVDGDQAWVDFEGKEEGSPVKGTAELTRTDGRWYLKNIKTRSGS